MIQFSITLIFSITLRHDNAQELDTRWDEIFIINDKDYLMIFWKVCTNQEYVSLIKSKLYWNCTTWKFTRRYRCPNTRDEKTMVKRSIDQKLRFQWKEKAQCSKGDQCSFRHETNERAKLTPKAAPPSEPQSSKTRGRSVSRKRNARGRSKSEKFNRPP